MKTKYIRDEDDKILIFSELINHSEFRNRNPKSAGFVSINGRRNGDGWADCTVYGKSISLDLEPLPDDENLIRRQILSYQHFML